MATSAAAPLTQDEILGKIYQDLARLASEVAIDRCRNRVLLTLVRDRLNVSDDELNALFQAEIRENLEQYCHELTQPMISEITSATVTFDGYVESGSLQGCGEGCGCKASL